MDCSDFSHTETYHCVFLLLSNNCASFSPTSGLFPPVLCGAARQISLHQDLLCALQSQRGGEHGSVSSLTVPFLCDACYFGLLWRILLLLLRSEEAGYLPDSDCAEVITVLYWKEGVQERLWRWGGWGEAVKLILHSNFRHFHMQSVKAEGD